MLSHGSEGRKGEMKYDQMVQYSTYSLGSEGRPEEMIFLIALQLRLFFELLHKKKVKIENGIWLSIDFICRIDCFQCVFLFTSQHFKTVRNQRKEALK